MKFHPWFATALLAMSGLAQAGVVVYGDAGTYNAALMSSGNVTPSVAADIAAAAAANGVTDSQSYGIVDPDPIVVGPLTFSGLDNGNAAGFLVQNTYGVTGAFYTHQLFNGVDNAFTITFASPIKAVAFESNVLNFTITGPTGNLPIVLTTSSGAVVNAYSSALNAQDSGGAAIEVFNGLISSTPFISLTIAAQTQAIDITSISTVAAAVPEPDVLLLVLSGLSIVGFATRRKAHDGAVQV